MSVPVGDRKESKFEAITFSVELHNMLIELMQRDFGIKDVDDFVRVQFAHGRINKEDFSHYQYLMHQFKTEINRTALMLTSNVRAANSIYPSSQLPKEIAVSEREKRRQYQDYAILNCETLINHLQRAIDVFKVDINKFERHVKAIDQEIGLIKKWRQRDNKIKSYLQG